jgi:hypothetical protein
VTSAPGRLADGTDNEWSELVRADCCHNQVHTHKFFPDEEEDRTVNVKIHSPEDLQTGADQVEALIYDNWEYYARRWSTDDEKMKTTERTAVARRTSSLLRTDSTFRDEVLSMTAPAGSRPIVAAVLGDLVEDVFERAARLNPTGANVVVGGRTGNLVVLTVRREADVAPFGAYPDDCPIHPRSDMMMLLGYLSTQLGRAVRCNIVKSDYEVKMEPPKALLADA